MHTNMENLWWAGKKIPTGAAKLSIEARVDALVPELPLLLLHVVLPSARLPRIPLPLLALAEAHRSSLAPPSLTSCLAALPLALSVLRCQVRLQLPRRCPVRQRPRCCRLPPPPGPRVTDTQAEAWGGAREQRLALITMENGGEWCDAVPTSPWHPSIPAYLSTSITRQLLQLPALLPRPLPLLPLLLPFPLRLTPPPLPLRVPLAPLPAAPLAPLHGGAGLLVGQQQHGRAAHQPVPHQRRVPSLPLLPPPPPPPPSHPPPPPPPPPRLLPPRPPRSRSLPTPLEGPSL
ncbi:unnamed protein product [Closterium sp. NIES-54]